MVDDYDEYNDDGMMMITMIMIVMMMIVMM